VAIVIKGAPFTGVAGYCYYDWEDSKRFDLPENLDSLSAEEAESIRLLKEQAETERRVTGDLWRKEIAQTRRASVESVNSILQESWAALKDLNRTIEDKFDRNQAPSLGVLSKSLEDVEAQVKNLLTAKRAEEPDEVLDDAAEGAEGGASNADGSAKLGTGAISGRREALKRLDEIAEFFKRTEPHSPVSYLVQRAVKWGEMPLERWLQEVIKDESVLYQLRETLGVMPGSEV
jgi:type VI secretion system protein ImpA